jgi:serine/threonine protein kinase
VGVVHDKGFVHRDLKPENIFLHRNDNGTLVAKVGDFGLSCEIGVNVIVKGSGSLGLGTRLYSSPEQYNGKDHGRPSDISYDMGCSYLRIIVTPFSP